MSDISPEQREPKSPPEVVQLDQEFPLFRPSRTQLEVNPYRSRFSTRIALDTKGLLPSMLNFRLKLEGPAPVETRIYPFDPEKGYTITNEDFDLKERRKKVREIKRNHRQSERIEYLQFLVRLLNVPLQIPDQAVFPGSFSDPNLFDIESKRFRPNVVKMIERLRLHLIFPNASFQGLPRAIHDGMLFFNEFFPLDSGPLAHTPADNNTNFDTGITVSFPNDPKYIEKVQGVFVLDPKTE